VVAGAALVLLVLPWCCPGAALVLRVSSFQNERFAT
jgi:hypothetical protein